MFRLLSVIMELPTNLFVTRSTNKTYRVADLPQEIRACAWRRKTVVIEVGFFGAWWTILQLS
jgi:hypothetical protein